MPNLNPLPRFSPTMVGLSMLSATALLAMVMVPGTEVFKGALGVIGLLLAALVLGMYLLAPTSGASGLGTFQGANAMSSRASGFSSSPIVRKPPKALWSGPYTEEPGEFMDDDEDGSERTVGSLDEQLMWALENTLDEGVAEVQAALKAGANPRAVDDEGDPALVVAAALGSSRSVQLLLQAGADPNEHGERIALVEAMEAEDRLSALWLLHYGADPFLRVEDDEDSAFDVLLQTDQVDEEVAAAMLVGLHESERAVRLAAIEEEFSLSEREDVESALDLWAVRQSPASSDDVTGPV